MEKALGRSRLEHAKNSGDGEAASLGRRPGGPVIQKHKNRSRPLCELDRSPLTRMKAAERLAFRQAGLSGGIHDQPIRGARNPFADRRRRFGVPELARDFLRYRDGPEEPGKDLDVTYEDEVGEGGGVRDDSHRPRAVRMLATSFARSASP